MSKKTRIFTALAGIFLLSVVFALAQGGMMGSGQSGMMNGTQNATTNNNDNNWYQQMMQQREQLQSRIQTTDNQLADELRQLQSAKTADRKIQILQTMLTNLIDERSYVHDQVLPMMMNGGMMGNRMMYGNGSMQNGQGMHSGQMGMQNGRSGMMNGTRNGSNSGNNWYRQMMQQRQNIESHVQKTDEQLTGELQKLQTAKTDDQKVQIMQNMLTNLITDRKYVHDQMVPMMMYGGGMMNGGMMYGMMNGGMMPYGYGMHSRHMQGSSGTQSSNGSSSQSADTPDSGGTPNDR